MNAPKNSIHTNLKDLKSIGQYYALPQWRWYLSGVVALIITNIIMLEIPQLAKKVINALNEKQPLDGLTLITVGIVVLGLGLVAIRTTSRVFIFWPGRTLEAKIKDDLFGHILDVPAKYLTKFGLGDLTSRLSNDVTQLRVFYAFGVLQILNVIFMTSFTVVKMVSINPILTLLTVIPLIIMLVVTRLVMPKLYLATREATEAMGRLTNRVTEAFVNVNVIQTSVAVEPFVERSAKESQIIYSANMRTVKIRNLIFPLMSIMAGISEFAILTWGGSEVISNRLSVGDLMAFNIYVGILVFPFTSIGLILAVYQRAKPAAERLGEIGILPSEADQVFKTRASSATPADQFIAFKNLSFSYEPHKEVLSNLSIAIKKGSKIGIYGAIGSGKSTLFNLLTRLYDPPSGTVFLDGVDICEIPPFELRKRIGFAPQTPLLFSESIEENLQLGFEETLPKHVLEDAARKAQILEEIERFPEKWSTIVGENGVKLSGGQKQRLALARLLLRKSDVYILDDVLSAVDHSTEKELIKTLISTQATLLIASHRTSILEKCDEIWILENGQITERGTFLELKKHLQSLSRKEEFQA